MLKPHIYKLVYKLLGFIFLGLAIIGIPLPVLPTTPFVLLSAWFFARSSDKWHAWLLGSELFGPIIRNWENRRCISLRTKIVAIASMAVVGSLSVFFGIEDFRIRIVAIALMLTGTAVILSIKTCAEDKAATD